MRTIHLALIVGQVVFSVFAFLRKNSVAINYKDYHNPLTYVMPLFAVGAVIGSLAVYKRKLAVANNMGVLKGKLEAYQKALISRSAPLEGSSLFGIASYLATGNFLFLIISGTIILYFIYLMPTKDKIENDLNLSYEEKIEFDNL